MTKRVSVIPVHAAVTADSAVTVDTSTLSDMCIIVVYTRSGSSTGTLTCYGTLDLAATNSYVLGIKPMITGTIDGDGAVDYTTSTTVGYTVEGVHQYIKLDWNEGTDGATISTYIVGLEDA